ncbi:MAG: rod shape-determining protein RodA [Lentisphaerae bacterium]|nr:rod shape-determining protein RodA [Lentisphaerota bacterium]MBQ4329758.1 rod shape-determining protein RodA [Lentisphaeria bacterium]
MRDNVRELPLIRFLRSLDYLQIAAVVLLLSVGLVFIRSTGIQIDTPESLASFGKQLIWIGIGTAVYFFVAMLDYRSFSCRVAMLMGYAVSVVLLVVVLFFGLKIFGATRWLNVFGMRLQPSEPAKLMVIGMLSAIFSAPKFSANKFLCFAMAGAAVGIPFFLIAIEPDLGSSLVLLPVAAMILFCFGIKWRYVLLGIAAVAAGIGFIIFDSMREDPILLRGYQRDRIKVFLNPGSDLSNRGHNAHQAKLAVGSGGLSGTGIGKGIQNELGFLPHTVSNNDFIFSVIAEETGFAGVMFLLLLYLVLLYTILRTAFLVSGYGRYIAVGVATLIFCHIFINIGMSIGIAPVTGLPLPLVSYGGSFILTAMTTLGLVQSVYRQKKLEMME